MKEYYRYKGNIYELLDHVAYKFEGEGIPTVLYSDGKNKFTREVSDFYERFTQIQNDSLDVAIFNLKNQLS